MGRWKHVCADGLSEGRDHRMKQSLLSLARVERLCMGDVARYVSETHLGLVVCADLGHTTKIVPE